MLPAIFLPHRPIVTVALCNLLNPLYKQQISYCLLTVYIMKTVRLGSVVKNVALCNTAVTK